MSRLAARRRRPPSMHVRYEEQLRLLPSVWAKGAAVAWVALLAAAPLWLSEFQTIVLSYAGVFAIAAVGLSLLTGYTGQISLGHAAFLGVGAYSAAWFGSQQQLPLFVWLPLAGLAGAAVGAVVGPFALRLRGNYLVVVTLGLVFLGEHLFENWESVTGGGRGTSVSAAPLSVGPVDFGGMEVLGRSLARHEMVFWLVWGLVVLSVLLAKNVVRTRPGRAMQAIRDRDVAAEVIGVSPARYKVAAFAVSSAFAAVAGGLYGVVQQFISPGEWSLFLSIQFIAIIIIGGLGTVFGAVLGAVVLGVLPRIIEEVSRNQDLPLVSGDLGGPEGIVTVFSLNQMIFGALIVAFLVFEPRGLAAAWLRLKAYFRTWPFSY